MALPAVLLAASNVHATDPWLSYPLIFFTTCIGLLNFFGGFSHLRKVENGQSKLQQRSMGRKHLGLQMLVWQIEMAVFLSLFFLGGGTAKSVGFTNAVPPIISIAAGFFCYTVLLWAFTHWLKKANKYTAVIDAGYRAMYALTPRGKVERGMFFVAVCIFNPFTEEIMFRGVMIYLLSALLPSPWIAIALGLLLNLGSHIYQGRQMISFHICFYCTAVALLYSPLGLWGAIGVHIAGDLIPTITLKRKAKLHRAHRKLARTQSSDS